jgi:CheY-like chemotaxis protein
VSALCCCFFTLRTLDLTFGYRQHSAWGGFATNRMLLTVALPACIPGWKRVDWRPLHSALQMPVMNGWAFRRKQQELPALAQIPVVVISGEPNIAEEAATMKAAGYLAKPVDLDALFVLLDRLSR